ncbi:hypothetical protein [Bifidobacterium indicum]|uniref:hypothetical protein n=1 Tax=Bifidobacterium indicum TaxID=1691 RepID=UPI00260C73AF|nr:hypothetical protein [uncultured Bifidobacterium sp.]
MASSSGERSGVRQVVEPDRFRSFLISFGRSSRAASPSSSLLAFFSFSEYRMTLSPQEGRTTVALVRTSPRLVSGSSTAAGIV